ncbi:hypothetical protein PWG71_08255 [Nocardiopsis sp. N85]|uniref:hypothetical protein n=1 Tax=Nocardiopsis sp. N85 TaxID=3029400 RepID=UPI00237FC4D3|nr:hypothetical protein [Nocardiopsis sp. N85]MDE3721378.1 hypothetical protein [Nocardiopsis sp. N85]
MSAAQGGESREVDRSDHHKHMDFVQAVINRLANNSFVMKGWALTVSSALLGFAVSRGEPLLALVAVLPALSFWVLDTYFLRQERAFRKMFDDVAAKRVADFEIKPAEYAARQSWKVGLSISLLLFYGVIILVSVMVWLTLALTAEPNSDEGAPKTQDRAYVEEPVVNSGR